VAIATGVEWRKESYSVVGDVYGNGVSPTTPFNANYPTDSTPAMNFTLGNNWYAGNFHNGQGEFDVKEFFAEVGMPLFDNESLGKMDLQLAGRATDYSTSGKVQTWKAGVSWATPVQGLRFRTVMSRDIRAPNLSELFAAPTVTNGTVINRNTNVSVTILNESVGNPALAAEEATTTEFGVAWTNPSWFPGLSASIDVYDIQVDGRIASLSAQQEVDFCFAGQSQYCAFVNLNGTALNPNKVSVQAFNLATSEVKGADMELSWRSDVSDWGVGLDGNLTLRGLATYTDSFIEDPGITGQIASDRAGENTGSVPKWKLLAIQNYVLDKFNLTFTERWFSDGVINNTYIECRTGCPVSTTNNPTITDNQMKGALYFDVGFGYKFSDWANVFFKVDNIADRDPEPVYSNAPNNLGANPSLYDTYGRTYRVGIRGEF
jgi:iron complex outermembrane receptor protein